MNAADPTGHVQYKYSVRYTNTIKRLPRETVVPKDSGGLEIRTWQPADIVQKKTATVHQVSEKTSQGGANLYVLDQDLERFNANQSVMKSLYEGARSGKESRKAASTQLPSLIAAQENYLRRGNELMGRVTDPKDQTATLRSVTWTIPWNETQ
ncbi:hypothetical protein [Pseudomonas sp. RtIB026]|uniref:hypothetical protein n=1 Tax=Pseudomonas sp. RtIB026 TaxID=2749999 RepID=UPI001AFA642E|nr:hypothetical protein [Pseudomonas sp. RtIB026]